ncbi:MAG: DUF4838 domain-containing protein [Opitutae bacterium]|nr:DUF4838 domain-containing protein [Opitutae bacterium]
MRTCRQAAALLATVLGLAVLSGCRKEGEEAAASSFLVFDQGHGCVVSLPENPSPEARRAAKLIQHTLAKASGLSENRFPIREQEQASPGSIRVEGSNHRKVGEPRLGEKVSWRAMPGRVVISSYPADAIEAAAAWFLEQTTGARWFMPGKLGEHVPRRTELRLPFGEKQHSPSFISRNLGLGGSPEEKEWWSRNRLRAWFRHGHAMSGLFSPDDMRRNPDYAPLVNGAKYFPASANDGNWQPNIAAVGAAEHAATILRQRREFSSAIGMNDSMRFDQSPQTRELIGAPRWFRLKPDYSKLVFRFVNEVAKRVPGRYLGAYAYDWTEDTPGFPIERNVVPYLTADRSEWHNPEFAEEDRALIRRWVAAGPEVVGLYDYYYGAPFLVPRPTLYAVGQSIPFAHQAGVRAFYAEVFPNWGLDGPKAWLAAQLLWDATAKPDDLLETYYRDFWREAAAPMREYFALCDEQWRNQPKPSYWLKYFKDEQQHLLFPTGVRMKLRGLIEAARQAAQADLTRQRVEFFAKAFSVTEAFCGWQESKGRLSHLALLPAPDAGQLRAASQAVTDSGIHLRQIHAATVKAAPLAVVAKVMGEFERNDPRRRAGWRLRESADGADLLASLGGPVALRLTGQELLSDTLLEKTRIKPPTGSMDLEWVTQGAWRGHGEPYETRRVILGPGNILAMRGCKQETFSQFAAAEPGRWYVARVRVRAKVSPGNMTYLILNFQDEGRRTLGLGLVDRLPAGDYSAEVELVTWAQAPAKAKHVGLGVRALNQVGDDYATFRDFTLQAAAP